MLLAMREMFFDSTCEHGDYELLQISYLQLSLT